MECPVHLMANERLASFVRKEGCVFAIDWLDLGFKTKKQHAGTLRIKGINREGDTLVAKSRPVGITFRRHRENYSNGPGFGGMNESDLNIGESLARGMAVELPGELRVRHQGGFPAPRDRPLSFPEARVIEYAVESPPGEAKKRVSHISTRTQGGSIRKMKKMMELGVTKRFLAAL